MCIPHFLLQFIVRFVGFWDCYFATIKDLCCTEMSVTDRQADRCTALIGFRPFLCHISCVLLKWPQVFVLFWNSSWGQALVQLAKLACNWFLMTYLCDQTFESNGEKYKRKGYQLSPLFYPWLVRFSETRDALWWKYFSADSISSQKQTVFSEQSSRKTVSFEEYIMPKRYILAYFESQNMELLCLLSFSYFTQHAGSF